MNHHAGSWTCRSCSRRYPVAEVVYVCDCDRAGRLDLADGPGGPVATGEPTLWRYAPVLPLGPDSAGARAVRTGFPAGWTPLRRAPAAAAGLGAGELLVKDESVNPTGSLKDRASALVVAAAVELGRQVVATASTGNAALALARAAEVAGMPCVVFVPARAGADRIRLLAGHGAHVVVVAGDYDATVGIGLEACAAFGWYCRTTAVNPFTTQGKKTVGLEIAEQCGGLAPDLVVVPVGDGNILVGLHRGLRDAVRLGWLDRMPPIVGVQAAGAAAVHRAWAAGLTAVPDAPADTVAGGIAVGHPMDGARAVAAVRESGGALVTVSDREILGAGTELAVRAGVVAEPSSAAGFAALPGLDLRGRRVVVVNTGGARRGPADGGGGPAVPEDVRTPEPVAPTLEAVRAALAGVTGIPMEVLPPGRRLGRLSGISGT
ncbi:pyridoxal-phosphate dependent enzyme [Streptomyces sp. NPDC006435]|uniref:threonine synthase n=1 Tax=Streptomyces sp. NPDC006435 TaxID=3154300 RepID=UPI0033B05497